MNNKKGLHRVFIILSFVTFISFMLLVNTVYIEETLLKFVISFCVASAVYLIFWIGIWVVADLNCCCSANCYAYAMQVQCVCIKQAMQHIKR